MHEFPKEYMRGRKSLLRTIDRCLKGGKYILGDHVSHFEKEFAAFVGTTYCIGVGNGLEALQIALLALRIGPGDEVITVANSDVATALAITHTGATPVFVDIDEYYHMNPTQLEAAITKRTKAILPVHLFGQLADMSAISVLARKHKIPVVEDACQAHDASFQGKQAGSFGTLGCFSFYPTKNLGAMGDAGAITTNSKTLYHRCLLLRNRGQTKQYHHAIQGMNSRMDELQAAILAVKLPNLTTLNKRRQKNARLYQRLLKDIPDIQLPKVRPGYAHIFHQFVIEAKIRDALRKYLQNRGIESQIHYPVPIHKQRCYREFNSVRLPKTERAAKHILSLPIHQSLSRNDIHAVCRTIRNFYNAKPCTSKPKKSSPL